MDVDLSVIMQRQVLSGPYRITVEVPQIQFIVRCEQSQVPKESSCSWTRCWRARCCATTGVDACGVQYIDKVVDVPMVVQRQVPQPEEGGATQAAASGKTTGCCEVGAHTNSHTDGQEESESGSGRGEGRSSKGDAPGCVPRVSEIRTADSERPTIHADQIAEEEDVKTAVGAAAVME